MPKAYCTVADLNNDALHILKNSGIKLTINDNQSTLTDEKIINIIEEYDILIIGVFTKLNADMYKHIKKPKIIATLSVGLDHIDNSFLTSPLVTIINIKTANAVSVAEHIFALILALNKRICEGNELVFKGQGHRKFLQARPDDISGKTLGLIGCGNITLEVIKIARIFNMQIKCFTKNPNKHQDMLKWGVDFVPLDELLKKCDIINVSVPLTEETANLISKEKIQLLKPNSCFINTSRTEVVDTKALIAYADLHTNFLVGLDIDIENSNLFDKYRHNVIVTPHIAGISKQAMYRMDVEIANKIVTNLDKLRSKLK